MIPTTVWFDLESGGTRNEHPTTQIAAVVERQGEVVEEFDRKLRFDVARCEKEALELQGYTPERWADAVEPADALRDFAALCDRHADLRLTSKRTGRTYTAALVGGYNVERFDVPRLRRGFERLGIYWPARWWYPQDVYWLAVWRYSTSAATPNGPKNLQLGTVAEHLGLDAADAHDALADCHLTRKVAAELAR